MALSAFHLPPGVQSNMFEGPAPLVRERDACGVGFIANTQEGGECSPCLFVVTCSLLFVISFQFGHCRGV